MDEEEGKTAGERAPKKDRKKENGTDLREPESKMDRHSADEVDSLWRATRERERESGRKKRRKDEADRRERERKGRESDRDTTEGESHNRRIRRRRQRAGRREELKRMGPEDLEVKDVTGRERKREQTRPQEKEERKEDRETDGVLGKTTRTKEAMCLKSSERTLARASRKRKKDEERKEKET